MRLDIGPFWKRSKNASVPTEREVSREYDAGIWSQIFFMWMSPLMTVSHEIK